MPALTDSSRVAALLGRALTADELDRVDLLLQMASDQVTGATGQTFVAVTAHTFDMEIRNGEAIWPQRPVTAVTSIMVDPNGGAVTLNPTQYDWDSTELRLSRYPYQVDPFRSPFSTPAIRDLHNFSGKVRATTNHGYSTVPGDVQAAVASPVAVLLKHQKVNPDGVRREALDGHDIDFYYRTEPVSAVVVDPVVLAQLVQNYGITSWSPRVAP